MSSPWTEIRTWTTTAGAVGVVAAVLLLTVGGCRDDGVVASATFGSGFASAGPGRVVLITRDGGVGITTTKQLNSITVSLQMESTERVRTVALILDGTRIGSGRIAPGHTTIISGSGGPLAIGGHGLHVVVTPGTAVTPGAPRAIAEDPVTLTAVEAG